MFVRTKSYEIDAPKPVLDTEMENPNVCIDLTSKKKEATSKISEALCESLASTYLDYCQHTSLHGVQYLGEAKRPNKERVFWVCVFVLSIYCCATLIISAYAKWDETPVIVSFAERSTPVWNIPFPAVTICSETKRVLKLKGNNSFANLYRQFTRDMRAVRIFKPHNITSVEMEEFRALLHVCNTHIMEQDMPLIPGEDLDYYKVLEQMLPPFERYFFYCRWLSQFNECDKYFRPTLTEEGICYTFNGLRPTDIYRNDTYQYHHSAVGNAKESSWSLETGYDLSSDVETYPARVLSAGTRSGIFITLQSFKQEVNYACRGPVQGFKVLLHAPDDVPQVSKQFVRIPMGREVLIAVKPNMITTSAGIAGYHPLRRQCFLSNERSLRFFKIYSESNCQLECLANFTLTKCGCVKFSMPRSLDMPVCGEDKIYCYNQAERELLVREFHRVRKLYVVGDEVPRNAETACNCMPACTSLVYNTEISQANFDLEEMLAAEGDTEFLSDYPGSQMSRLSIYFKQNQFITSKRSELYGVTEFLANCGGIFGLFMGFSILSLVELLYHFTLRFGVNLKQLFKGNT